MCCPVLQIKGNLIEVDSLNQMFEQNNSGVHHRVHDVCNYCKCDVEIKITKTFGGYGIQGGALYETDPQNFFVLCPDCYKKLGKPV